MYSCEWSEWVKHSPVIAKWICEWTQGALRKKPVNEEESSEPCPHERRRANGGTKVPKYLTKNALKCSRNQRFLCSLPNLKASSLEHCFLCHGTSEVDSNEWQIFDPNPPFKGLRVCLFTVASQWWLAFFGKDPSPLSLSTSLFLRSGKSCPNR